MPIQSNGRKCPLQIFCQNRTKFLIFRNQLFCEIRVRLTRQLKALHQFTYNMLSIRSRTTISGNQQLSTVSIAVFQNLICVEDLIFYSF